MCIRGERDAHTRVVLILTLVFTGNTSTRGPKIVLLWDSTRVALRDSQFRKVLIYLKPSLYAAIRPPSETSSFSPCLFKASPP